MSDNSQEQAAELISARIDKEVYTFEGMQEIVQRMLCSPLSTDRAIQIALLNNPRMQELLQEIGIAQADLIEAGLLSNPIFEGYVRYPDKQRFRINTSISVMQNFLDLLLIPLRVKVTAAELQQTIYQTSHQIIALSFEVEQTYYQLIAAYKQRDLLIMMSDLAEIGSQMATAQRQVSNINALDLQLRTAQYLDEVAKIAHVEKEIIQLREKLNTLMGLTGGLICWSLEEELPYIPENEPSLECLEWIAFNNRLDLQAARWEIERFRRSFPTAEWWNFTQLQAGISSEKEVEGVRVTGPQFLAALPIFNFGQGARRRLFAQFRQAEARLSALEIEASAEVRQARDLLLVARNQVILYAGRILPNQEQIISSTEELYNVMGLGIFELLDHKKNQLQAYLNYYMALKEYWISHVELDKAVGGKLEVIAP